MKEYFRTYLLEIRGLSSSTVKHYEEALRKISQYVNSRHPEIRSIYEIDTLDELLAVERELKEDPDFTSLDRRGHQMYSSGFSNYLRFARGETFAEIRQDITRLDRPVEAYPQYVAERTYSYRNRVIITQALESAHHSCHLDEGHITFTAAANGKQYMEVHHLLPISFQEYFSHSLDIYANLVVLCPNCHRSLHHGIPEETQAGLDSLFSSRKDRLADCGIRVGYREFREMTSIRKRDQQRR